MTVALRLDGISAAYGTTPVLEGVSLDVPAGSLMALLGPSGCGRTTLLRVVAGLVPATTGDVMLGDARLTHVPTEHRGLGVVFQKPLLFPHMSVAENVGFGLTMRRIPRETVRTRVRDALHMVQLDGFDARRPRSLSGGQEQRVALARALVTQPRVLLLDEPLTALDEHLRGDMRGLIRTVQRQLGITTLFVTHDQREATDMADAIALLLNGRLVQVGAPRVFYTEPQSGLVARFFGWCVLDGHVAQGCVTTAGGVVDRQALALAEGTPVEVAFHPGAARVSDRWADGDGTNRLPATVERGADLGHHIRMVLRLESGDRLDVTIARTAASPAWSEGAHVQVVVPPSAVRFFPKLEQRDRSIPLRRNA